MFGRVEVWRLKFQDTIHMRSDFINMKSGRIDQIVQLLMTPSIKVLINIITSRRPGERSSLILDPYNLHMYIMFTNDQLDLREQCWWPQIIKKQFRKLYIRWKIITYSPSSDFNFSWHFSQFCQWAFKMLNRTRGKQYINNTIRNILGIFVHLNHVWVRFHHPLPCGLTNLNSNATRYIQGGQDVTAASTQISNG